MSSEPVTAPEPVPGPAPRTPHPLSVPHFRNLWLGATISLLGDQFYLVALPMLGLQLTGSGLILGTLLMVAAIPRAVLMLIGGAVIDRFSARRVLMTTAAVRALLVGGVAVLVWLRLIQLWELYALTFCFGVSDAFSFPAGPALMPTLVKAEQLQSANALLHSSTVTTQTLGSFPAGWLISRWGVASALFFDAVSFLGVIAALLKIPDPPKVPAHARPSMLHAIAEGLRTVRHDPALLALMSIFATINLCFSGPVYVGLPLLAQFQVKPAQAFGAWLFFLSGGMLVGILFGGRIKQPRRRGLQFIVMSLLTGLELIGIGLIPTFGAIATFLALIGLGVGFVNVQFSSWIQLRVDRALLGRVMSVLMFAAVGLVPVSQGVSGVVTQWWRVPALFIGAGTLLAVASAVALTGNAARHVD
ncbi:MAG TPA: MFS transporter [Thermoanaerobaculia bacterium]|jgi:MFS family permease